MINKKILSFFLAAAAVFSYAQDYELPAPPGDTFVYFNADEMDYDSFSKRLRLLGDVNLIFVSPTADEARFYADNLAVDRSSATIFSDGEVRMEQNNGEFKGRDLKYNYETRDLSVRDITAFYPPIRVLHARRAEFKNGKQIYKGAKITCCDREKPDYYVRLGSVSMSPEKRIFGTNALLYLNDIPVFYLPVFWRSLDSKKPYTTYVDFTQSNKTGFGLLTSTVFYPVKQLRAIVNLDGYLKSGFGYGGQLLVKNTENVKGNVEAYAINDLNTESYRWGVTGDLWAQLFDNSNQLNREDGGAIYMNQSQFRTVSDPYFNDTYFRSNPYKFMPDQDINFAFSRQSRKSITRLSYSQKDEYDFVRKEYDIARRTLPRLEYQLMPFTLPFGLVNAFSANIYNTEFYNEGYNQTADAVWRTARAFKINRTFTLTPYVTAGESLVFDDQANNGQDSYVTRAGAGANLRAELITGSLDVSYGYTKRFSTGTLTGDSLSDDRGVEQNKIYVQNFYRPTPFLYFRLGSGYDLRDNGAEWNFDERLEPVLGEIGVNTSDGKLNLFAQELYDVKDGSRAFIFQSDFKVLRASRAVLGMTNHANDINSYLFNTKLWFRPAGVSWYFDAGVDFEVKRGALSAYSKSFLFHKDFHDAGISAGVIDRNKNLSFNLRLNVYCGKRSRTDTFAREDRYWSPWRSPGDLRD